MLCVYVSIQLRLCLPLSFHLPHLGRPGEEKQSFTGQSPKVPFKTLGLAGKTGFQVRGLLPGGLPRRGLCFLLSSLPLAPPLPSVEEGSLCVCSRTLLLG